jgi:hypothetical protein
MPLKEVPHACCIPVYKGNEVHPLILHYGSESQVSCDIICIFSQLALDIALQLLISICIHIECANCCVWTARLCDGYHTLMECLSG